MLGDYLQPVSLENLNNLLEKNYGIHDLCYLELL